MTFDASEDFYRILHVHESADQEVISAAYKALVKKYHPDVRGSDGITESEMMRINQAYEVLGEPGLRREYDGARMSDHKSASGKSQDVSSTTQNTKPGNPQEGSQSRQNWSVDNSEPSENASNNNRNKSAPGGREKDGRNSQSKSPPPDANRYRKWSGHGAHSPGDGQSGNDSSPGQTSSHWFIASSLAFLILLLALGSRAPKHATSSPADPISSTELVPSSQPTPAELTTLTPAPAPAPAPPPLRPTVNAAPGILTREQLELLKSIESEPGHEGRYYKSTSLLWSLEMEHGLLSNRDGWYLTEAGYNALKGDAPPHTLAYSEPSQISQTTRKSLDIENWRNLRGGMSTIAVRAILGEPETVSFEGTDEYWRYPNCLEPMKFGFGSGLESWAEPLATLQPRPANPLAADIQNWRKLQGGMTIEEVSGVLGEPETIMYEGFDTYWYYPNCLDPMKFGLSGRLERWSEPLRL